VLADRACNGKKRDRLPATVHLAAWAERNERFGNQIHEPLEERGFIAELEASNQVAHWAYAQAEAASAMTWLRGDEMPVSFQDSGGVRHAVEVGAETLYEAAVLGLKSFREDDCAPGPAAHLAIEVRGPSVTHTVVARKIEEWLTPARRARARRWRNGG
jgi:hypothetical protein